MLAKTVLIVLIILIIAMLAGAVGPLLKKHDDHYRMVRFLKYRVAFSALLLVFLILSVYMGWLQPHGLTR
jgi:hypothetical protein